MIATEATALKHEMLELLRREYDLGRQRDGMHVSDLAYCLTKSFWNRLEPEPATEDEIGLWSIGWALERVMISRLHMEPLEIDGIIGTLDFAFPSGMPADLKTTRLAPKGRKGEDGFQFPAGWLKQFMAYRYLLNKTTGQHGHEFGVVVVHLIQAKLKVWELYFSDAELEDNWRWLLDRSNTLESMLASRDPQPFQHRLGDWECSGCSFKLRCDLVASGVKYE